MLLVKIRFAKLCLIITIFFLLSCKNPFTEPHPEPAPVLPTPPAGMGFFSLRIAGNVIPQGRVIMPSANADQGDFDYYRLVFSDVSGVLDDVTEDFHKTDDITITIEAGTYDLTVTAYADTAKWEAGEPAASGELLDVEIPDGEEASGEVVLRAIDNEGFGTFSWNIEFPDDLTRAYMVITPQTSTEERFNDHFGNVESLTRYFVGDGAVSNPGSLPLPSGHYRVVFYLGQANTRLITWRETLHVYQNIDSHFQHEFTDYVFLFDIYTVTFIYGDTETETAVDSYMHGETVNVFTPPARTDFLFDGWYTEKPLDLNDPWNLDKLWKYFTPLTGDLVLYARWLIGQDIGVGYDPITDDGPQLTFNDTPFNPDTGITIWRGETDNPDTAAIAVSNWEDYADIEWVLNGASLPKGTEDDFTLILKASEYKFGTYFLTVRVWTKDTSIPYSRPITFTVKQNAAQPVFTVEPQHTRYIPGETKPLTAAAESDGGTLTFQWYRNTTNSTDGGEEVGPPTEGNISSYTPDTSELGTQYYYVVVTNENTTLNGIEIATETSDVAAVTVVPVWINRAGGTENELFDDLQDALSFITESGTYTVHIAETQTLPGHPNTNVAGAPGILNVTGTDITLIGVGMAVGAVPVEIRLSSAGRMFTVSSTDVSLTLGENITLVGRTQGVNGATTNNTNALVRVEAGGAFTMLDGSKITGNTSNGASSGMSSAVTVTGAGTSFISSFTMNGGEITGNHATYNLSIATGGLYVMTNTSVKLNGGSIIGNTGVAGDIFIVADANFELLEDAEIGDIHFSLNSATNYAFINIAPQWSGNIQSINLVSNYSQNYNMETTISSWNNNHILRGGGVNTAAVGRAGLGNFIDSSGNIQPITAPHLPAAPNGYWIANSGADIGRLSGLIPGSGTEGDPFLISSENWEQVIGPLGTIHNNLDKHYKLEADIDLSSAPVDATGSNWTRIGNNPRFTGSFDGGGHTITGLTINETTNYQGMFGSIGADGEVKNLGLVNVNITGNVVAQ